MKRPHRRSHLIMWIILAPITIIASVIAFKNAAPEPYTDLDAFIEITTD